MKRYILLFSLFIISLDTFAAIPKIDVNGFGTTGIIKTNHPSYFLTEYGTSGSRLTFQPDSKLGINLSSVLSEQWTLVAQFIAKSENKNYRTKLDWGFVSYHPMPEFAVRLGKIVSPLWLYSQQINVGYSYLWVRPPVEVYSLVSGLNSINGVSILTQFVIGSGTISSELFAGAVDEQTNINNPTSPATSTFNVRDNWGADLNYSYNDIWSAHASYSQGHADARVESYYSAGSGLYYTAISQLSMKLAKFFSAGGKMDYKNFLLTGEFARRLITGQSLQSANAWYTTVGYRIGKFTPYFTYSWQGNLRGAYYLHPDAPTVSTLKKEQYSDLLGINIQLHDSIILKAEAQKTYYKYIDPSKNFDINIFSSSVDFVF